MYNHVGTSITTSSLYATNLIWDDLSMIWGNPGVSPEDWKAQARSLFTWCRCRQAQLLRSDYNPDDSDEDC